MKYYYIQQEKIIHSNTPTKMKKTAEEIAQWIIDNRYAKSENNKIDDRELYDTLVDDIKEYRSQASDLPSDDEIETLSVKRYRGEDLDEQKRNSKLILAFEDGMKQMRSIALASRDARIKELEECLKSIREKIQLNGETVRTAPDGEYKEGYLQSISNVNAIIDEKLNLCLDYKRKV